MAADMSRPTPPHRKKLKVKSEKGGKWKVKRKSEKLTVKSGKDKVKSEKWKWKVKGRASEKC